MFYKKARKTQPLNVIPYASVIPLPSSFRLVRLISLRRLPGEPFHHKICGQAKRTIGCVIQTSDHLQACLFYKKLFHLFPWNIIELAQAVHRDPHCQKK